MRGNLWLNPPFSKIEPWAAKCAASAPFGQDQRRVFLLVPAGVGSEWFAQHIHEKALVLAVRPRLTFVGHSAPYPKDTILAVFGEPPGFETWRWQTLQARRTKRAA